MLVALAAAAHGLPLAAPPIRPPMSSMASPRLHIGRLLFYDSEWRDREDDDGIGDASTSMMPSPEDGGDGEACGEEAAMAMRAADRFGRLSATEQTAALDALHAAVVSDRFLSSRREAIEAIARRSRFSTVVPDSNLDSAAADDDTLVSSLACPCRPR